MKFVPLYFPFALALIAAGAPDVSYWLAWSGSWFILWYSLSGWLAPLPQGLPWYNQMLRPFALPQIVFASFISLSSVFYYFSLHGYVYFERIDRLFDIEELRRTAEAQRYYVLAHAALVHGIFVRPYPPRPRFQLKRANELWLNLRLAALFFVLNLSIGFVPGLSQWRERFGELAMGASILLFAAAIVARNRIYLIYGTLLFGFYLYKAVMSGFKELVIVPLLVLLALLYPRMKGVTTALLVPAVITVAFVLPLFVQTFRGLAWKKETDQRQAVAEALAAVRQGEGTALEDANWYFLTTRFSEISMFTRYIKHTPGSHPFYGFQIIEQSLLNLVPRALYPGKPVTEEVVLQRILENKIIEAYSIGKVSAKPMLPVDGYTSFGAFGVWLFCFLMGIGSSYASREAERLFGGYVWGTGVVYTFMFQSFWRSNCLEFLLNSVVYAFILMYLLFYVGRKTGYIVPVEPNER